MSSDGYYDDDDLNDAAFQQLDAIEAALLSPGKRAEAPETTSHSANAPKKLAQEGSFYDLTLDIEESEFERLDEFIEDTYQGKAQPVAGPSKPSRTASKETFQTTLFGDVLPNTAPANKPRSQIQRTKSTSSRNVFGQQARKTKQWDQTAFAKSGSNKTKAKSKGKGKATYDEDEEEEEEEVEFEQFPAPFVSVGPPPPMKLKPDLLEAKHWIFPMNQPKRDYQFNIVKNCFFDNTIVALPTGLGKTFIAGVVMLNFYRWFPDGKVVFVAPTKPLVAQQIDASHRTCGIPGSDAIELTGQVAKPLRGRYWKEKRVFYMTPQTLINDLQSGNCDPLDIVLLVVDEAHRATGDYAYNQVVRFLMATNPHFRVLALTATPGSNPDAVQALVDGLHISHIEIRDESSLDLKPYMHHKKIEQHIIAMSQDISKIREPLAKLMDSFMKPLKASNILGPWDKAELLHPYRPQALMGEVVKKGQGWACGTLSKIASLARAMGYLTEGTLGMCYTYLKEISLEKEEEEGSSKSGKKADKNKKLRADPLFQTVMRELESQQSKGFSVHPKMERLNNLIINHFGSRITDTGAPEGDQETKAMVFVTYREAVDEIVEALNLQQPLIRAHKFIGQGTDKQGKKGLAQREQLEVIERFKSGEFNVLVATSIGEEGLDIGEVDVIVCYDAQKTPIRMLQRSGRTGRKRAGIVHVLLAEGREETNFEKAKDAYKEVQKTIVRGEQLELYGDVERLLPGHIKPHCLEKKMDIEEYVRQDGRKKASSPTKGVKRKRNDDIGRNIPMGASTGFVSVADLVTKGNKRKKQSLPRNFNLAGEDHESDEDIESGRIIVPARRTKSTATVSQKASSSKGKLRKAATIGGTKTAPKTKKKKKVPELTSSQFSQRGLDDSDDMDIEQGIIISAPRTSTQRSPSATQSRSRSSTRSLSPVKESTQNTVIDLTDSEPECNSVPSPHHPSPARPPSVSADADESIAWLVDDDDDDPDIEIVDSSPLINRQQLHLEPAGVEEPSIEILGPVTVRKSTNNLESRNQDATFDQSVEFIGTTYQVPAAGLNSPIPNRPSELDESIEFIQANSVPVNPSPMAETPSSPSWNFSSSPRRTTNNQDRRNMPPPDLPRRSVQAPPHADQEVPEPSFPVQPIQRPRKRRIVYDDELESPALEMPPPSQHRLRRQVESTPARKRTKKSKPSLLSRDPNPLFDFAAAHSGDEVSEGDSNSEDDVENEYDREFIKGSPLTQASPSYDQSLAYRQSLFTQAAAGSRAPVFANRPVRPNIYGPAAGARRQAGFLASSSPPPSDPELDDYVVGSFVVDDDAEISYANDSQ